MDVFEAIKTRRSVRSYKPSPVPNVKLEKILEAGRMAPSAKNSQPWHFIVVKNSEMRSKLASTGWFAWFLDKSPVVIVGCGDHEASPQWCLVDVAIAMENMVLTATAEGLGTCWVGSFDENQVKKLLEIPAKYKVVALLALGYPAEKFDIVRSVLQMVQNRKPLERIVSFEKY